MNSAAVLGFLKKSNLEYLIRNNPFVSYYFESTCVAWFSKKTHFCDESAKNKKLKVLWKTLEGLDLSLNGENRSEIFIKKDNTIHVNAFEIAKKKVLF